MRPSSLQHSWPLAVVVFAAVYVGLDFALWEGRTETIFALNADRVCIRSQRPGMAPRFEWLRSASTQRGVELAFYPLNRLRRSLCAEPR